MSTKAAEFFRRGVFVVAGASKDREKFGNKVLRCYLQHQKPVIPLHRTEKSIEGVFCVNSLAQLSSDIIRDVGVSVVTPPAVTRQIIEEANDLGMKYFLFQPGTLDDICRDFMKKKMKNSVLIESCVLQELGCDTGH